MSLGSTRRTRETPGQRRTPANSRQAEPSTDDRTKEVVWQVCGLAGRPTLISEVRNDLSRQGVLGALNRHDTPLVYNWMVRAMAYQGISDYVAHAYMEQHGSVTWSQIEECLGSQPSCPKLRSYWRFHKCGYDKTSRTCRGPSHFAACPLPAPVLRNGRLNQSAFSLYFFMRDIADRDFVGWLESTVAAAWRKTEDGAVIQTALLDPLQHLFGLSSNMLTMILSDLLIGGARGRPHWLETGAGLIVVDTLVHNFLHRTGILHRHDADHAYGPNCYGANGCASVLRTIARQVDARQFNPTFPANFPRFVQHAIWRYCAQQGLDICNGNRIDDRHRCGNSWCPVFAECDRVSLRSVRLPAGKRRSNGQRLTRL